ncbi:MAG: biotin--[acetyl-CoA-carboxylase] ligase [bacterium]|nr:biotin--[acetyl-CoA-carboxylase] ligase [bacterium]
MRFLPPQWIERVASTNTSLLEQLAGGICLAAGTVLATDEQTAGRGRGDHQWQTKPGRDLACSFVLHAAGAAENLCSLSMAVALGVTDMLAGIGIIARTKWPNDVTVGHRKICGILPELSHQAWHQGDPAVVVVGVGLNVGMSHAEAAAIDQPATSVHMETGRTASARDLLPELLAALAPRLERWSLGGFASLRPDWENRCAGLGEVVTVIDGDTRRQGVLAGFGNGGQLLLTEAGRTVDIWAGHLRLGGSP